MKTFAQWICRLLLGVTFAYAAVQKISDPATFATDIGHYRLLSYPLTLGLALYLPWIELHCAAAVLSQRYERGALLLLAGLCGIFALALASAWVRGLDINCGCFSHSATPTALPWALARSLTLGGVALWLLKTTECQRCSGGNPP